MKAKALTLAILLASAGVTLAGTSEIDNVGHHTGSHSTAEINPNVSDTVVQRSTDKQVTVDENDTSAQNKVIRDRQLYEEYAPYNDPNFY